MSKRGAVLMCGGSPGMGITWVAQLSRMVICAMPKALTLGRGVAT
jgi:hypothetical protein